MTGFHESWVRQLGPDDLADPDSMYRLLRLVEVEPEILLPYLADLIESATPDQLAGLDHLPNLRRSRRDRWAARRQLVWLAEWLLRFPEFCTFAERILYRLALTETEGYGNNATAIWCQSYRPRLSGTPISFADRIAGLERRFGSALTDAEVRLCLRGLVGPLTADDPAHRMSSPPLVSGRIPPPDWSPATHDETRGIWRATVDLLARLTRHPNPVVADGVVDTAIRNGIGLIRRHLNDFVAVVESHPIGEARRVAILELLERFLQVYCHPDRRVASADTEAAVRTWRQRLIPAAFRDRLRTTLCRGYYDLHSYLEDHGEAELSSLASELIAAPGILFSELSWLYSTEARSAHGLGMHLGRLDEHGDLLDQLADAAVGRPDTAFLRGYVIGLLDNRPTLAGRVSGLLDRLTPDHPDIVFELLTTKLGSLDPLGRTLALVDDGLIPATHLRLYWRLVGTRTLSTEELTEVLTRMLAAARSGDAEAGRGAVDVLLAQVYACRREQRAGPAFERPLLPLVHSVLEASLASDLGRDEHAWGEVLTELGRAEPVEAVRLAIAALGSDNSVALSDATEADLAAAAPLHPEAVMTELGGALLDPHRGIRIRAHDLAPVLGAMPVSVVQGWVDQNGLGGARAIAPFLPAPVLHDGVPTVPELTAFVLDRFGEDEEVFAEFCMGATDHDARVGDIAADYDRDARVARAFRTHPSRWVREWARAAEESARGSAEWWRADNEELETP